VTWMWRGRRNAREDREGGLLQRSFISGILNMHIANRV
jgi:hypothetical protein